MMKTNKQIVFGVLSAVSSGFTIGYFIFLIIDISFSLYFEDILFLSIFAVSSAFALLGGGMTLNGKSWKWGFAGITILVILWIVYIILGLNSIVHI